MCSREERRRKYVEDIRDLCLEVSELEFEFPKHFCEPLFVLINEKLRNAIESTNLYSLEILLDSLNLIGGRNIRAEQTYETLAG